MTSPIPDAPEPFRIELEPRRATIVVAVHGEIDIATSAMLKSRLHEVMDAGFRRVVLDLRDVSFMDSSGLRVVLAARSAGREAEVEFALIAGPDAVQRVFEVTGTSTILRFVDASAIGG